MMSGWDDLGAVIYEMAEQESKLIQQKAALTALETLTEPAPKKGYGTPVETGNLLANTTVSLGSPTDADNGMVDQTGSTTYARGAVKIKAANPFEVIYIQNDTEYNTQAEFEGWFRKNGTQSTPAYRYFQKAYSRMIEDV